MNSSVRIETLTRENYDTWKLQMRALLTKNDAWAYVSGELQRPAVTKEATTSIASNNWIRGDSKAKSDIILSISPSELKLIIKGCETSREVWLRLESIYQSKGPARKATLLKQLTLLRMEDGADVREHVNKFFDTVDKLEEMDIEINKDLLSIMLLYSMPSNFENFRCAIESRDELPTPETLRVKILKEYEARRTNPMAHCIMPCSARRIFERSVHRRSLRMFARSRMKPATTTRMNSSFGATNVTK